MNKTWIVLDCNYLCHRAFHATGDLSYHGAATGTLFGFFQALQTLQHAWGAAHPVFCWDKGQQVKRHQLLSTYKSSRIKRHAKETDEEREARDGMITQMHRLRDHYLRELGYHNNFCQYGYEADDVIAMVLKAVHPDDEVFIISADQDLWQLLGPNRFCYNPHTSVLMTDATFRAKHGIPPQQWANVKALAGCTSDDVIGVRGVGEVYAAKWFAGTLNPNSKAYQLISNNLTIHNENLKLTRLPYPDCQPVRLKADKLVPDGWRKLLSSLGMGSLIAHPPKGVRNGKHKGKETSKPGFGL